VHSYLQVFFNLSLVLVFLYLLLQFILTVQRDVEQRIADHSLGTPSLSSPPLSTDAPADIAQEISACAAHYRANACASGSVPAMAAQCAAWEQCMARDPSRVGRARVGAELVAEVVNGFVEPISWKTLVRAPPPRALPDADEAPGVHAQLARVPHALREHAPHALPRPPRAAPAAPAARAVRAPRAAAGAARLAAAVAARGGPRRARPPAQARRRRGAARAVSGCCVVDHTFVGMHHIGSALHSPVMRGPGSPRFKPLLES
jgi:hypothetical protein